MRLKRVSHKVLLTVSVILLFGTSCGKKRATYSSETILVQIDEHTTISVDEFIRRAEYTIRPPYCRLNNYIQKKIILNSLIAEKLFALEAGQDNPLSKNEAFQKYIKGRKEQAMRQWMYHHEATQKAKLEKADLKRYFSLTGREYEIEYYSINNPPPDRSKLNIADSSYFKLLFQKIYGDSMKIPERKVTWGPQENDEVQKVLYGEKLTVGQVLPAIQLDKNNYLMIKIKGWTDSKAITENQIRERYDQVTKGLIRIRAGEIWNKRVARIMKGKSLQFNKDTFNKVNDIFFKVYFRTSEDKENQLIEHIWDQEKDLSKALDDMISEKILERPFFEIDGNTWTVDDFRNEIMSHPLVFRESHFPSKRFAEQFRLAVADMIRDHYITEEAYQKGYDKSEIVQREENMWRDAFLALYQKNLILSTLGEGLMTKKNYMQIIGQHLNTHVDSLQKKYYKQIQLDFDEFENIALTSIDLYTQQKNQPYTDIVPVFPLITTDHNIDYIGRKEKHSN